MRVGGSARRWIVIGLTAPLAVAVPAAQAQIETVVITGKIDPADPCMVVAGAKAAQWSSTPLKIRETRTLGSGVVKESETIFTVNQAYAHYLGRPWNTTQFLVPERRMKSAGAASQKMQLAECRFVRSDDQGGDAADLYEITYKPDADGSVSTGEIWIANANGLPLRQVLDLNALHPDPNLPVIIAASFTYGDAVKVPREAQLAEYDRRSRTQQWVKAVQENRTGGGP